MTTDIFIPVAGRFEALRQCLLSLRKQTVKNFRILLVAKEEKSEIVELVKEIGDLDVDHFIQTRGGLVGAANDALARARAEIFSRIDSDVVLDEHWLESVLETFRSDPKIGGVTGPTIISKEGLEARDLTMFLKKFSHSKKLWWKIVGGIYQKYIYDGQVLEVGKFLPSGAFTLGSNFESCLKLEGLRNVDYLEACNWSAKLELVKKIGGFDEIFSRGLGDYHEADAAMKIKKLGFRLVFNSRVRLWHKVESGKVPKARAGAFWRIQNFFIFYGRHVGFQSPAYFFKFFANVILQNGYYFFRFLTTGKISQLGAIPGTLVGTGRMFFERFLRQK